MAVARDEGGPRLTAQVLVYPALDARAKTPSREEFVNGPFLSVTAGDAMWGAYLGDPANASSPLACPVNAESFAGLAPALIITNELDPFRDEAEHYGRELAQAGVETEVRRIAGMIHGVFGMSGAVPRVREFHEEITAFLEPRLALVAVG